MKKKLSLLITLLATAGLAGCDSLNDFSLYIGDYLVAGEGHTSEIDQSDENEEHKEEVDDDQTSEDTETIDDGGHDVEEHHEEYTVNYQTICNGYYKTISDSMSSAQLLSSLKSITKNKSVSVSYDWSRYEDADEDPNNSKNIIAIYSRYSFKKTAHVNGSNGWNREHTFPQSKISVASAKSDNHIIFASDNKVNGTRGNKKLKDLTTDNSAQIVEDSFGKNTPCLTNSNYFDPGDTQARGIVARATMYSAVMYDFDMKDNFDEISTLLKWNLEYAPDENDIRRNDVVFANQHNRNPFVDCPQFACKLWGDTNEATRKICGGK